MLGGDGPLGDLGGRVDLCSRECRVRGPKTNWIAVGHAWRVEESLSEEVEEPY